MASINSDESRTVQNPRLLCVETPIEMANSTALAASIGAGARRIVYTLEQDSISEDDKVLYIEDYIIIVGYMKYQNPNQNMRVAIQRQL